MNHSEQFAEVAAALAKAQGEMKFAEKTGDNPHFKSTYATLASIVEACKTALTSNGIACVQFSHENERGCMIETIFYHSSGQYISAGKVFVPVAKNNAHGMGSAMTYARRYALAMACGVPQEDDDGNTATVHAVDQRKRPDPKQEIRDRLNAVRIFASSWRPTFLDSEEFHWGAYAAWVSNVIGREVEVPQLGTLTEAELEQVEAAAQEEERQQPVA